MIFQRQSLFWGTFGIVSLLGFWLLWDVALPFLAALVFAYLLDPLVRRIQKLGLSRLLATLVIMVGFVFLLTLLLVLGIPALVQQITAFAARLPQDVERLQSLINQNMAPFLERFGNSDFMPQVHKFMGDISNRAAAWLASFLPSLISGGKTLISFVSLVFITPIVVFYLLLDWRKITLWINSCLPIPARGVIWSLSREMAASIDGFLRGQLLVCVCLGSIYAFGLWMIGLSSGITIGLIAGLLSFIPYVGTLTGLILAVSASIAQFWPDWAMILATLGVFMVGQFIEGNILSPKLVGGAIGVHPVWLMFALLAFASLFGFGGVLIATPAAAIIGVLVRFSLRRYRESIYYRGSKASFISEEHQGP